MSSFNDRLPPVSGHADQVAVFIQLLRCVVPSHSAVYLSTPITSGSRYLEWHSTLGNSLTDPRFDYPSEHRANVVAPNSERAKHVAADLRLTFSRCVIDPSSFPDIPEWTQDDYRAFWGSTVTEFAHTVVFMDGWEFSTGCVFEFFVSTERGITRLAQNLAPLIDTDALGMLERARLRLSAAGQRTSFHDTVIAALNRLTKA